jgi:lytic murein transglycosylase
MPILRLAVILAALVLSIPAQAARCGGDFNTFVAAMSQEAAAAGISQGVISQAFAGVTQDPAVLSFDRRQRGTFNKTFEQYVSTRVGPGRIKTGKAMLQRHASLLARIQQRFGVPPEIVVAIWGLESDFGKGDIGKMPVIRTLTTMAHDCRRTELFQGELLAALKILQRGDLPLRDLIGAYAGELGQTQFLPSSYIKYGVDFDGNGHVDLRHSIPDVLASTANLLKTAGFRGGQPYGEGHREFRSNARMEPGNHLPQDHRLFRGSSRGAVVSFAIA